MNKLKPAIVIGSGGHAKVLIDTLLLIGQPILFCTDVDEACHGKHVLDVLVSGHDDIINEQSPDKVILVNGLGSIGVPSLRRKIFHQWTQKGFEFLSVIHPAAHVSSHAIIKAGVQVMAGSVIQTSVHIGANSVINTCASIDHDCRVGEHCHVAPGVTLSGSVELGELCHIGTGSQIVQSITIGDRVVVGAGATVTSNIPDDSVVVGTPAKPISKTSRPANGKNE